MFQVYKKRAGILQAIELYLSHVIGRDDHHIPKI